MHEIITHEDAVKIDKHLAMLKAGLSSAESLVENLKRGVVSSLDSVRLDISEIAEEAVELNNLLAFYTDRNLVIKWPE